MEKSTSNDKRVEILDRIRNHCWHKIDESAGDNTPDGWQALDTYGDAHHRATRLLLKLKYGVIEA